VAATVRSFAGLLARRKACNQSVLVWTVLGRFVWAILVTQNLTNMLHVVIEALLATLVADIFAATSASSSDSEILCNGLL
jgi:hypothetical protein